MPHASGQIVCYVLRDKGIISLFTGKRDVSNDHVYITGAGSGIGRKTAIEFAKLGSYVTCVDIDLKGAEETVKMIHDAVG